jgi:DNA polymerase elongation subunit (family B)
MFTSVDKVHKVTCDYDELFKSIATETKQMKFYNSIFNNGSNIYNQLQSLHKHYGLFSSDLNIIDYKMYEWKINNKENTEVLPITKAFYDIEVDTVEYEGFPHHDIAPCPIFFISYIMDANNEIYSYILDNPDNPSQQEFINQKLSDDYLKSFADEIGVKKVHVKKFTSEIKLIRAFLKQVQLDKPDFLGAWNAIFDLATIVNRIRQLTPDIDPIEYFCPHEFEYAHVTVKEDTKAEHVSKKKSTFDITGYTQYVCLLESFANIRASMAKRESYSLDSILFEELGESKYEYEGTIKSAAYENYEKFWKYSVFDSFRLLQLENKNRDINLLNDMSLLTNTRFAKVMSKTISIRNFAYELLLKDGYIIANNHNKFIEHEKKKFKGAFVATPDGIDRVGTELFKGFRSNRIFSNVIDEDLASLYPNIIQSNNIDSNTLIGKILFPENPELEELFPMLISENDYIQLGNVFLGLPTIDDVINTYLME